MRFMIGSAGVVVTGRSTSTIGWCLMSGRPLCFFDKKSQLPLREEARSAFRESLFVFDADAPGFHDELSAFLSLPQSEIEHLWREKKTAREQLIRRFVDAPIHASGDHAAEHVPRELLQWRDIWVPNLALVRPGASCRRVGFRDQAYFALKSTQRFLVISFV